MSMKPTDVGTRYGHYRELLDLWEAGVDILKNYSTIGKHDLQKLETLETAVALLRKQIDVLTGCNVNLYSFEMRSIRDQIDHITNPS